MTKKQINKRNKLVDKVNAAILEEPKRMNMDRYLTPLDEVEEEMQPACGTVACYAGWAVALRKRWGKKKLMKHNDSLERLGQEVLGVPNTSLFYVNTWPYEARKRLLMNEPGTKGYAKAVVAYAKEYFKKLDKEQLGKGKTANAETD